MPYDTLSITGLSKRYSGFSLGEIDLTVPTGCIFGLVGANGAGKTTTIKCVLGTTRPQAGSIRLFGEEVSPAANGFVGPKRFAQLRQDIGFVPDTCAFPEASRISAVGELCRRAFGSWDAGRFDELRGELGLEDDKTVGELSRGMGMKLSLACALAHRPRLLVLDEATAGLDPLARDATLDTLRRYVAEEDCGILMSSHITSDLEKAADRIACIDGGRIAFDVATDDITDRAGIARCRAAELDALLGSHAYEPGTLRLHRTPYATDVLVPDRFEFAEAFPEIAVDRASVDDYLALMLKGEIR